MSSVVAYIRACSADSAVPLQSIKSIAHRPLAYWAVRAALLSRNISKVHFITDSAHIKRVMAANLGIAGDKLIIELDDKSQCTDEAFVDFCSKQSYATHICWINVNAVLLEAENLEEAISIINKGVADSVVGVVEQPQNLLRLQDNNLLLDMGACESNLLQDAGVFFISPLSDILDGKKYATGRIAYVKLDSDHVLDINNHNHFSAVENYLLAHHPEVAPRRDSKPIKIIMMGVDGVLTDNSVYYDVNGGEIKRFSSYDNAAFQMLHDKGYKTAIISSHSDQVTKSHAERFMVDYIFQGVNNKLEVAEGICEREGLSFSNVAFIGDDVNDIDLLKSAGIAACPSNAVGAVKAVPNIIHLSVAGGGGVLRSMLKYVFGEVLPEEVAVSRNHLQVHRPWGAFEVLTVNNGYKAKRILVRCGGKLSLQMHHHRSEHWIVVQGIAHVNLGGIEKEYNVGEHIYIPLGTTHRLENRGTIPLEVLEVSLGSYLEEDDIIRLEDVYGRV